MSELKFHQLLMIICLPGNSKIVSFWNETLHHCLSTYTWTNSLIKKLAFVKVNIYAHILDYIFKII